MSDTTQDFNDKTRLGKIIAEFSRSDAGKRLLSFAQDMEITVEFDPEMPKNIMGIYNNNGFVLLSPTISDAVALGTLSHELHHAEQETKGVKLQSFRTKEGGGEIFPIHDPVTHFYLRRLEEAGAFAFQIDFAREHALATRDTGPASFLKNVHPEVFDAYINTLRDHNNDRALARHAAFTAFIDKADCYDADTLSGLKDMLANCRKMIKSGSAELRAFLQEKRDVALTPETIVKFGEMEDGSNFLAGRPDHEFLSEKYLGRTTPAIQAELKALDLEFKSFFGGLSIQPVAKKESPKP